MANNKISPIPSRNSSDVYTHNWIRLSSFSLCLLLSQSACLCERVLDVSLAASGLSGACSGWLPSASRGISADIAQALRSLPGSFTESLFPSSSSSCWHAALGRLEDQPPNSISWRRAMQRTSRLSLLRSSVPPYPTQCRLKSVHLLTKHQTAYYEGAKGRENHSTFLHWDAESKRQFECQLLNDCSNLLCSVFTYIALKTHYFWSYAVSNWYEMCKFVHSARFKMRWIYGWVV